MKRFVKVFFVIVAISTLLTTTAYAATVFQVGPNLVTNTERWQYIYDGYGQCQGSYSMGQYIYYNVYIRYSGGAAGDTGRIYSADTYYSTIESVSYTYRDTLNPWAPQTTFNYGFSQMLKNLR